MLVHRIGGTQFLLTAFHFPGVFNQVRGIRLRSWWKKEYLKDIYHRRLLAGPEPLIARSAHPDWHYPAEISAFSHRIGAQSLRPEAIQRALTNRSFFERPDVLAEAERAQPSMDHGMADDDHTALEKEATNEELVIRGEETVVQLTRALLRIHWPNAPEEFISAVADRLHSNEALVEMAGQLAVPDIVRTKEFPPDARTVRDSLLAVVGLIEGHLAYEFVLSFLMPRLNELSLPDVLPFRQPFPILEVYFKRWKNVTSLVPRLLHSGAVASAMPFYEVGIYATDDDGECQLVGKSTGEQVWVALDLAAQEALFRLWGVGGADQPRVFPFHRRVQHPLLAKGNEEKGQDSSSSLLLDRVSHQPNHSLAEICGESGDGDESGKTIDLSLYTADELAADPINIGEVARYYAYGIRPVLGLPLRKRLRHPFARGTIMRKSARQLVQPKPHSI